MILHRLQVPLILRKAHKLLQVTWLLSAPGWTKLKIQMTAFAMVDVAMEVFLVFTVLWCMVVSLFLF